jgi:hypothetical protein
VAGNHRRILLLAAEAAAGFRLHDAHAVVREAEQHGQRAMDVVRALHRPVHRDAPPVVGRHGNDPVGLDVELLLGADPVLALDNLVSLGQAGVEIAFVDGDRLERENRHRRIVVGSFGAIGDANIGGPQPIAVVVHQDQDGLGDVTDRAPREARLVVVDERDDVASGDVVEIDNRKAVRVEREGDVGDRSCRDRRPDRARVEQVRKRQVVDISRRARYLVPAFLAGDVASDGLAHSGL